MRGTRRYVLRIDCPDRVGIVAAISGLIAQHGGWVIEAAQHGDLETGRFFMRLEVLADSLGFGPDELVEQLQSVALEFEMSIELWDTDVLKRVVILVSTEGHCLADLLYRWSSGELPCEIVAVVSHIEKMMDLVAQHRTKTGASLPFYVVPFDADRRDESFSRVEHLLEELDPHTIVLARYMRILPADICRRWMGRILNIHHSFLPSFVGARPYHQAFERGVKLIGATCHYVTAELDAGPIIEQDALRVDHGDTVEELHRVGRDVERIVLARGLRWHLEDRVLLNGNRTVIFD